MRVLVALALISVAPAAHAFVNPGASVLVRALRTPASSAAVPVALRPKLSSPTAARGAQSTVALAAHPLFFAAPAATKWVLAGPVLYALMSVNEYFTHRYYQHAEYNKDRFFQFLARTFGLPKTIRGGGHVEHHAETYDDMLLKTDDAKWMKSPAAKSLNDDPWRGTAFTWQVTAMMTAQMVPTTFPVFMGILKFSFAQTMAIFLPGMILHALVWNALHPNMHGLPDVPIQNGAPSSVLAGLRNTWYFRWLYQNHEGHHVVGGQGNYNVACPLTDHLVGTYVKEQIWRPRVDAFLLRKEAKAAKKAEGNAELAFA